MPLSYTLKDISAVEAKVTFLRVSPNSKRSVLGEIFNLITDLSWTTSLARPSMRRAYENRSKATLDKITQLIEKSIEQGGADQIVSEAAEYVVSFVARETLINDLGYGEVPMGEVLREQASGNPGFDFYAINLNDILLFGEAKFKNGLNAYGAALEQIERFIREGRDYSDMPDLLLLVPKAALDNMDADKRGFIAAFASIDMDTAQLIKNIKRNPHYSNCKMNEELVLVAVDMI